MKPEEAKAMIAEGEGIDAGQQAALDTAGQLPAPAGVAASDNAAANEWLFVPEIAAMVITELFPETAPIYTQDLNLRVAVKLAAVAEKRGWAGSESSPEIGLGIAAIGFSMPAVMAYKARKQAAIEAQQGQEAPAHGDRQ